MAAPAPIETAPRSTALGNVREFARAAGDILRAGSARTRTQRDAATAFGVRTASAAILYLSQVVLARWMGGYEYGIYVFVWTWMLVMGALSGLGLPVAMIRLVPEYLERHQHAELRGLLRGGRMVAVSTGIVITLVALSVLTLLGDRIGNHYALPAYLALACVPLCALSDVQDGIGRSRGWMAVGLLPPYILRPLLLLGCMSLAHLWGLPMDARTAAGSAVVATWAAALVQTLLVNRRFAREIHKGPRVYPFKAWAVTALPLLVISACEIALQTTDVLVVSAYLSPTEVGMYYAAAKTMSLILFVHYAVGSAVANRFAALNTRGDRSELQAVVRDAVNWTFWPSLAGAVTLLVLGQPLLWLFSPHFTAAYPVMFVLAAGFLVRSSMGPAEFVLNMLGQQSLCALVLGTAAILNVVLCFALVPVFGMIGAAAATSIALSAAAVMNYLVARRQLGLDLSIWENMRGR